MTEHNFSLMLEGDIDAHADELYEAGLADAILGETNGIPYAEFDREAPTRLEAIVSAIRDVRSVSGVQVVRVEPEEYLTASEIAQRTGKSREAIRLLASGQRGRGTFPRPFLRLRDRSPLWRWSEIAAWTSSDPDVQIDAAAIGALNAQLEIDRLSRRIPEREMNLLGSMSIAVSDSPQEIDDALEHIELARDRLLTRKRRSAASAG
jgi:predicted DNA-binding transcriptional regulator AlpA